MSIENYVSYLLQVWKNFCSQVGALIIPADFVHRERFVFKTSRT